MIERFKRGFWKFYKTLSPQRRALARVESRLSHVSDRKQVDDLAVSIQSLSHSLSEQQVALASISDLLKPLMQVDEIRRDLLQQAVVQSAISDHLRDIGKTAARLREDVQPLSRLDEIERRLLQRQDEHTLAQGMLRDEVRSVGKAAKGLREDVQPLKRLDEIERRLMQRQDEQLLIHTAFARQVGEVAAELQERLQPLPGLDQAARQMLLRQDDHAQAQTALSDQVRGMVAALEEKLQPLPGLDEAAHQMLLRQDDHAQAQTALSDQVRGVIAALEEKLQPLPGLDEAAHQMLLRQDDHAQAQTALSDQVRGVIAALEEKLQPLPGLDEAAHQMLLRQDDHARAQTALSDQVRGVIAALEEKLQPLPGLDEAAHQMLLRQDDHAQAQTALSDQVRGMVAALEEKLQPLPGLDEAAHQMLLEQNRQASVQAALIDDLREAAKSVEERLRPFHQIRDDLQTIERDLTAGLSAQLQPGLARIEGRVQDAVNHLNSLQRNFVIDMRLHDRQLRTALTMQDHLMASKLLSAVETPNEVEFGAVEMPQISQIVVDKGEDGAMTPNSASYIEFLDQKVYFDDLISLYVVFKEIFLYQDYFVDLGVDAPNIIDAGAHIGLATIYFKDIYPKATITCFEPDPRNFELLERNTAGFGSDVTRVQKAVTADGKAVRLMRREGMSMASSIYQRSNQISDHDQITAEATTLSSYLRAPVDLLKLDIEGPEAEVLTECRNLIGNVHYLFIEFHTGDGLPLSRLRTILTILDEAGFTYQIERAREYQTRMMHRPFTHLDTACTHVLHARNSVWPPKDRLKDSRVRSEQS